MESAFLSKEEQAPLTACQKCQDRPCIKTGKICKDVEKLLKKVTTGKRNWLTYKDPDYIAQYNQADRVLIRGKRKGKEEALFVSKGKRKRPLTSEE